MSRPWLVRGGDGRPPFVSEQHAAARFWAAHGFPVCRLIARDKRPTDRAPRTTGAGPQHRLTTTDLDRIDAWWQEVHPHWGPRAQCNPGLPTGRWPGFVALDVDRPHVFASWVAGRPLPTTLRWSSCRPDHPERYTLLFNYPLVDFPVRSIVDARPNCVPGVDLRADHEHVVLPGALHPRGTVYSLERNERVADLPGWLVAELAERARAVSLRRAPPRDPVSRAPANGAQSGVWPRAYQSALRLFERAVDRASVVPGQRHRVLVGLAWEGLARGLHAEDVRRAALAYADRACPDPSDRAEATRQLEDALARPRTGPPNEPRFTVAGQERWLAGRTRVGTRAC